MKYVRYLIDGPEVKRLRELLGWSQRQLARKAGIAERTIVEIEHCRGTYDRETVKYLAKALGVVVEELSFAVVVSWRAVPDLPKRIQRERVAKALDLDMMGRHEDAAAIVRAEIRDGDESVKPEQWIELRIRLISMLDNSGHHSEALAECEALLARMPADMRRANRWLRYHQGICERRLGRYEAAEATFQALLAEKDREYDVSVKHQLGVLRIQLAKTTPERRAEYLDEAAAYLHDALKRWDAITERANIVPHGRGFTMLRLAEVHDLQGNIDAAIEACIESLQWLAWHHLRRYIDEAIRELRRLIRKRTGGVAGAVGSLAKPFRPRDKPKPSSTEEGPAEPPLGMDAAARPRKGAPKRRPRK